MFLLERNRWICLFSYYSTKTLVKIFPLVIVIEFGVLLFLLTKGMGFAKIKSFFAILKMIGSIRQRKIQLDKKRKLTDSEIITYFVNEISVPGFIPKSKFSIFIFNIIKSLSRFARNLI
jgi:hypothetical protein